MTEKDRRESVPMISYKEWVELGKPPDVPHVLTFRGLKREHWRVKRKKDELDRKYGGKPMPGAE